MNTIILLLILLILSLDFYLKYNKLINVKPKEIKEKPNNFFIKRKGVGDKVIEDLTKNFNNNK